MHPTASCNLEVRKFRKLVLPSAQDPYIAKLLIGKVLCGELPAVLIPPIFVGNKNHQHRLLGILAMQVLQAANPDLSVTEDLMLMAYPVTKSGELGMHIDGSTELDRGLRLHTNINRGSRVAFAAVADNYAVNLPPGYRNAPSYVISEAEVHFNHGQVDSTMISDEVYVGDQPKGYSVVAGINGPKNVWHRYETINETGEGPRLITVSDVRYGSH